MGPTGGNPYGYLEAIRAWEPQAGRPVTHSLQYQTRAEVFDFCLLGNATVGIAFSQSPAGFKIAVIYLFDITSRSSQ